MKKHHFTILFLLIVLMISGCANSKSNDSIKTANESDKGTDNTEENEERELNLIGKVTLSKASGRIGDEVKATVESLQANKEVEAVWVDYIGSYQLENRYSFIGTQFDPEEIVLAEGKTDGSGKWEVSFKIPDGFGDDHDILFYQDDKIVAKANFFVEAVFAMSPKSGPPGTEITISAEGISWKMFGSLWHLNYDNNYTGMITAVSTRGKAKAVIRATGKEGPHTISIDSGPFGAPYLSIQSSAINQFPTARFTFNIVGNKPVTTEAYAEEAPEAAGGGIKMPDPVNKEGVTVKLSKTAGTVGEQIELTATGLPKNEKVKLDWHTMVGTRVTTEGFGPELFDLGETTTDNEGNLTYKFKIPDDLGGTPHLIDLKVNDEVYGQTYLRILPKIVSISPTSGPVGTEFTIKIKGSGWTEFDNAWGVLYDNSYIGYACGFYTQGTITLKLIATGEPGYHFIDFVPSIYTGQQLKPDYYIKPMLTYREDHPGTGIPALRAVFEVTE